MYGPSFQKHFTHQVEQLKEGEPVGTRLSLNVRYKREILEEEEEEEEETSRGFFLIEGSKL